MRKALRITRLSSAKRPAAESPLCRPRAVSNDETAHRRHPAEADAIESARFGMRNVARPANRRSRVPGTQVLPPDFFRVPVPEGFHSMDPNEFDITTAEGLKLYRLRQAYMPDRWGFLGARSPYTPRLLTGWVRENG
jgi:hypothetical protein